MIIKHQATRVAFLERGIFTSTHCLAAAAAAAAAHGS